MDGNRNQFAGVAGDPIYVSNTFTANQPDLDGTSWNANGQAGPQAPKDSFLCPVAGE